MARYKVRMATETEMSETLQERLKRLHPHALIIPEKLKDLKLTIELVPKPCWYSNMRTAMSRSRWDTLRRKVYAIYDNHCALCANKGMLHCHEIWQYDDTSHVQMLKGFIALCPLCHHCKHIGLAGILASKGEVDFNAVVDHFCSVNGCSKEVFEVYQSCVASLWERRNVYEWTTDLGEYAYLIGKQKKETSPITCNIIKSL